MRTHLLTAAIVASFAASSALAEVKRISTELPTEALSSLERAQHAAIEGDAVTAAAECERVIALAPDLQKRASAENVYFHGFQNDRMGWGHWNERGHAAAAALIAPRLCAAL